ncbi:hypothetical protein XENOCAPTIV_004880 [Xenoophorus captivus]|uniref:Uncharacterized protein n=1 Tax=Xenoophorus captivus TaxID=1517983 RepID=A0ABV0QVT6_9TELE
MYSSLCGEVFSPVACTPSSEEMRCKMGADLEADNPQALILLPCGRFQGNPFPVARNGAVKPVGARDLYKCFVNVFKP